MNKKYRGHFTSVTYMKHISGRISGTKVFECSYINNLWRDCGGHVSHLNGFFYGNDNIVAQFYLLCDAPFRFIEVE